MSSYQPDMAGEDIRKSDRFIPWYFVAFFLTFIVVDAVFVYIATTTHTGVVTDHAYKEGISYNETVAASDAQDRLGWQGTVRLDGVAGFSFRLADKAGKPLSGAKVQASFMRPTSDGKDFTAELVETEAGLYEAAVAFPLPGVWDARVFAGRDGQEYQHHERLIVGQ
ncbi:MAG: hypothetical protein EP335_11910 [Alphaproteobacteria bacterium]|nr:MAG: hypothetical protein EP335_11910 [Alphaproteobacteria bacterium]